MDMIKKVMTKVIQPLELLNCDLTKANQELLAATVIDQLNVPTLDAVDRYARARFLFGALAIVCDEVGAAGEAYCEENKIGEDGNKFPHNGLWFMRKFETNYNFAANDDVPKHEGEYRLACIEQRVAKNALDLAKTKVKNAEKLILKAHPKMIPAREGKSISFLMEDK